MPSLVVLGGQSLRVSKYAGTTTIENLNRLIPNSPNNQEPKHTIIRRFAINDMITYLNAVFAI